MFGLSTIKLAIYGAVFLVVATVVGGLFWQNQSLKREVAVLNENNGKLTAAHAVQSGTIDALEKNVQEWKVAAERYQETVNRMAELYSEANKQMRRLNDVFSKHDLTALSLAKPGLIERRINSGTVDVLRGLRDASAEGKDDAGRDRTPAVKTRAPRPEADRDPT